MLDQAVFHAEVGAAAPALAYLVSEDWYFMSHRLPMAQAAQKAGYRVHVLTHVTAHGRAIEALGFTLHPLPWRRGGMNPLRLLALAARVRRLYRKIAPALVHHVSMEGVVVGSLAAAGLPMARVNGLNGLGFPFVSRSRGGALARGAMRLLLRALLTTRYGTVLVQNPDDRALVEALGVEPERITLIPGSGVDIARLRPLPEPAGPVTLAFVGRLLDYKGIRTVVAAQQKLETRGRPVRLLIAGTPDPANPTSVPADEIETWRRLPDIAVLGHVDDIRTVWAEAHVAVLPSRREGIPKTLLEAAACGRPLIAADAPGCREVVRHGITGLLVPPDNTAALVKAIDRLAADPLLRYRLGRAARDLVEREFSDRRVAAEVIALYRKLGGGSAAA